MERSINQILPFVESLGDNCELGFYLRDNGYESGSLFRWAICPIEPLIKFIDRADGSGTFEFSELVPASPGMVLDQVTNFRFHTSMRSVEAENGFVFEHKESERLDLYKREKRKYDYLADKFHSSLNSEMPRIFVVKANEDLTDDAIERLHDAIAARKNPKHFVLLAVSATGNEAARASLRWEKKSLCYGQVCRFADYTKAFDIDVDSWNRLLKRLLNRKKIQCWLDDRRPLLAGETVAREWDLDAMDEQKNERVFKITKNIMSNGDFSDFLTRLKVIDRVYWTKIGGDIHDLVYANDVGSAGKVDSLDKRYLLLIQIMANFNMRTAIQFHDSAASLYKEHGSSFVRYARLTNSLKNTLALLHGLEMDGKSIEGVRPKMDSGFRNHSVNQGHGKEYFTAYNGEDALRLTIRLPIPRIRKFKRCCDSDDSDLSESMWINQISTIDIDSVNYYLLPNARVCHQPTGVSFEEQNERRYVYSMSDMFHYFRVSGKTAFDKQSRRIDRAYILPRFGLKNYYHALVDRLPGLFGYKLLKLNCPIVSTYPLDSTERHFASLLGIEPNDILVDLKGEIQIDLALLPNIKGLRPLFFDYLSEHPKNKSPYGNRIYISRKSAPDRVLANESEIQVAVSNYGFDIVAMEEHTLDEQMAIAANADTIVGPHGAGLANMVFAKKNSTIIELIPDKYMTPLFKQLTADCGHSYGVVIGETESANNMGNGDLLWSLEQSRLDRVLQEVV